MAVSRRRTEPPVDAEPRGARARTLKLVVETATALMQEGLTPSVSDVAEAAGVSRATAYRYFPTQADLVNAVVEEALGPILEWRSDSDNAIERVADLLTQSIPRIIEFEASFKAALRLTLEHDALEQAGALGEVPALGRDHRVKLLQDAISPLRKVLPKAQFQRLARALSLVYGLEGVMILKDVWGIKVKEVEEVAQWTARALVRTAIAEAASKRRQLEKARSRRST